MKKNYAFKTACLSILFTFLFTTTSFAQDCPIVVQIVEDCALFEDFEDAVWNGTGYALRQVTDQYGEWSVTGVCITTDDNDRKHGTRSIRLRGNAGDNCYLQMNFDKPNGIGEVSYYYASYSTHGSSGNSHIVLYYSTNGGTNWAEGGSVTAPPWSGEMLKANFPINIQGNVRIKIIREGDLGNGTSVNIDDLCLTNFVEEGYAAAPTFEPPGGSYIDPINVMIASATAGATIRYTLDGSEPNTSSTQYSTPLTISTQTTIKAKAWAAGMEPSTTSTAIYTFPQSITTIAALRANAPAYNGNSNPGSTIYKYSGQAVVTQIQQNNGVKYIQDGTGAIMIFDPSGKIKQEFEIGDKITGISGTLTNYFGMLELIPTEDCTPAVWGPFYVNTTLITASQLNFDHANSIQAKVVTIKDVLFVQTGNFAPGTYYDLIENGMVYDSVFYTDNYKADYLETATAIPAILVNIDGVILFKGTTGITTKNRIVMLDKSNGVIGEVKVSDINKSAIKLSPNPANNFVDIVTGSPMKLDIYSLLGNLIATENLNEGRNTIHVSQYPAGIYVLKLTDISNGQVFVQKLVVK